MKNIVISVKDLIKNYGSFNAVKGISFDVYEGEIFGLLGPNGACQVKYWASSEKMEQVNQPLWK